MTPTRNEANAAENTLKQEDKPMNRSNEEICVVETGEGCESCVIATTHLVMRVWLDSQDPDVLGGHVTSVSFTGARAMLGRDEADFAFNGSRDDLVELIACSEPVYALADLRFDFQPVSAGENASSKSIH